MKVGGGGRWRRSVAVVGEGRWLRSDVFVIIADNDVKWKLVDYMLGQYVHFIEAVRPTQEEKAGIMRRKDFCPVIAAEYNIYLSDSLGDYFKSS